MMVDQDGDEAVVKAGGPPMSLLSFAKTRLGLLLISSIGSGLVFAGTFEIVENIRYQRWKADFDNRGWFGRITVPSPNPLLMWEYRPYGEVGRIRTNRHGFRDFDYESRAKPAGTWRIAFAGDSATLGMGVAPEETFVRQFEIEANQERSGPRIQALNFAVDGYNTPQILEMIRTKVLDFSPDRVVYVMGLNDFDFSRSSGKKILYFRKPRSFFLSMLENAYARWLGGDFHRYEFRKNKEVVFQKILEMRGLLQQAGSGFQVVLLPVFPARFDDYPLRDIHEEVSRFLDENSIRFLDLLGPFAESGELPGYHAYDIWHPNARGHRFIAQQLVASVVPE